MRARRYVLLGAVLGLVPVAAPAQQPQLHLCAGSDRVVRVEPSGRCPAGQTAYTVAAAVPGAPDQQAQLADISRRLAALEQAGGAANANASAPAQVSDLAARLRAVEQQLSRPQPSPASGGVGNTVRAPFTVVDADGKPIFRVNNTTRSFNLLDQAGHVVALGSAIEGGGFFKVLTPSSSRVGVLGAVGDESVLQLRDGAEAADNRLSLVMAKDGKPVVLILNDDHTGVVALSQGTSGGGLIQVDNAAGDVRLEQGVLPDDVGAIHAGPQFNCAPKTFTVPDCIAGHK
jgi:hypothetical protein